VKPVVFLAPAEDELVEAAHYYDSQAPGLGSDFLVEIQRTLGGIEANPEAGTALRGHLRRRLVRRFPYGILYRIDPMEIIVLAVMHLRRQPGYWVDRL